MHLLQQNKQAKQPKRVGFHNFLASKTIYRSKKISTKKSVPPRPSHLPNQNSLSTFNIKSKSNISETEQQISHRILSSNKSPVSCFNTNVVTIQFIDNSLAEKCDQKELKVKRKGTIFFNSNADQIKKQCASTKTKLQKLGPVEESLIIQPLHRLAKHIDEQKRRCYNYYLVSSSNKYKKEGRSTSLIRGQTSMDFRQFGKQIVKTEIYKKVKPNFYILKASTETHEKNTQCVISQRNVQTIQLIKPTDSESIEKQRLEKLKQKQITELLIKQYKQIMPARKPSQQKNYFVFGMSEKQIQPENRIQLYRDFLWKVNYSNSLYVYTPQNNDTSYKAYIGFGNNSCMLKSILRRRGWWNLVESSQVESCQFVWTQLKMNSLFKLQPNSQQAELYRQQFQFHPLQQKQQQQTPLEEQLAHKRIYNMRDCQNWDDYAKKNAKFQQKLNEQTYNRRLKLYVKKNINKIIDSQKLLIHNHLQFNYFLGNKKALFYNIKTLCQLRNINSFEYIPVTFHISKGVDDQVYQHFLNYFNKMEEIKKIDKNFRNIWICKPGENTNRGNGISVCTGLDDIRHRLRGKQKNGDGKARTFILQKYIQKPFLYKNRKFDIRHYMLITCFNGNFKAYWFNEGYIRTSSSVFSLKNATDLMIHLTNDAVQKKGDTYGKHQKGNKLSYEEFQAYLQLNYKKKYDFMGKTLQKMKQIALMSIQATYSQLDPNRRQHNFELIGFDFMIDENFTPWLIEANTNPCLELSSPLLQKLIPTVIEHTFRICIDPFFPPPQNYIAKNKFYGQNALLQNRYELIFDQSVDGKKIKDLLSKKSDEYREAMGKIEEDNEVFEDDGNDDWQQQNTT